MRLRIMLFDKLHVSGDTGRSIPPMRPRARRLFAFLLLHRDQLMHRQQVAFSIWPDVPEQEALSTLRRALSDLQTSLPTLPGENRWINVVGADLGWNAENPYWLDIETFEERLRRATPAALHEAVDLYRGDLLTTSDNDWVVTERERLRQLHIDGLRKLVTHHRALANYEVALEFARQAVAHEPLSESLHRDVITLHYDSGDRAAALAAYDELSRLLSVELDVDPMPETKALREAIVHGGQVVAEATQNDDATPIVLPDSPLPALIGRDEELTKMQTVCDTASTGSGRLILLDGEAGVGKTHLARHLAERLRHSGCLALVGHCYEFEQAVPFQPIVEMLRSGAPLLRRADLSPAHRASLARLVPDVLGTIGSPIAEIEASPTDLRVQLFESLLQAFLALARSQPLLLLIEDAHWAAESTLDWLTYSAPRLHAARVLVIVTYRTDELGTQHVLARLSRRLAREPTVSRLTLEPLSLTAVRELVAQLSGLAGDLPEPVAERLYQETAGNPFFLHEIIHGLIESGQIIVQDGCWSGAFVEGASGLEVSLPDSLRDSICDRVERLVAPSRSFLQGAAVAGRMFDYETVRRAGGWPDDHALEALEDVLERGFVRPRETGDGFVFAHHLVQEAIYDNLTAPRRVYWHGQFADTLVQTADHLAPTHRRSRAGEITYHALRSGNFSRVFEWAPIAAEHAYTVYAYADAPNALEMASNALEHLRDDPDFDLTQHEPVLIEMLLDRAALMPHVGRPLEEHEQVIGVAADLLTRYPDERLQARFHLRQADYLSMRDEHEDAVQAALNAYQRYVRLDDQRGAAQALYLAAACKITISQNRAGRDLFEQSLALYRAVKDVRGESLCLSGVAWSGLNLGEIEFALDHLKRALELSDQRGDKPAMARICYTLAAAWAFYNNAGRMQDFAERSMRLYREVGFKVISYRPMLFIAEAQRVKGEFSEATRLFARTSTEAHRYHDSWLEGWASQMLGRLAMERGGSARGRAPPVPRLSTSSGEPGGAEPDQRPDLAGTATIGPG